MDSLVRPAPGTNVICGPAPRQVDPSNLPARNPLAGGTPDPQPSRWFGLLRIPVIGRDRAEPSSAIRPGGWGRDSARVPVSAHLGLPSTVARARTAWPATGQPYPADQVMWGIPIRDGYDELYDPSYHRGLTGHAYLAGHDDVALCGYRPPQRGLRTRRPAKLGIPTALRNPMCGTCARTVAAGHGRMPAQVLPRYAVVAVPVRPMPAAVAGANPVLGSAGGAVTRLPHGAVTDAARPVPAITRSGNPTPSSGPPAARSRLGLRPSSPRRGETSPLGSSWTGSRGGKRPLLRSASGNDASR